MTITGYLSEFSLAELFRFLDQGYKTGLLTLKSEEQPQLPYYIWSHQGRIVAAANSLEGNGLTSLIQKRGWLKNINQLDLLTNEMPLGLSLKAQSILDAEQLKMLFIIQVMRTVCTLFTWKNAWFEFNNQASIPQVELTGLSAPATEITLAGLRALKDWSALKEKLPEPTSSLLNTIEGKHKLNLHPTEWQIWELSNGKISVNEIAQNLELPLEKVQQTAFCLIVIGLAEEVPMVELMPKTEDNGMPKDDLENSLSQSFLANLVNFLDQV